MAATADSGAKLRLRRQDVAEREAALEGLLQGNRTRLEALLGRRGQGARPRLPTVPRHPKICMTMSPCAGGLHTCLKLIKHAFCAISPATA